MYWDKIHAATDQFKVQLLTNKKRTGVFSHFVQVAAEELAEVSQRYEIVAVPTIIFLKVCW